MKKELINSLKIKADLFKTIEQNTKDCMQQFSEVAKTFGEEYCLVTEQKTEDARVCFRQKNQFTFSIQFNEDLLIFVMRPDVFEFPRDHEVMRSTYIKEDKNRSYCGMIQIYNFLSESFKYKRTNDLGYMIGRILINKDGHYFVEGKKELAQILNNFSKNQFAKETAEEIFECSLKYTLNFDMLLPDYELHKVISVNDILYLEDQVMTFTTAKRLGFTFEKDNQ